MGVDICFYMEVRKREKWIPMVIQIPSELVKYKTKEDEGKEWYTESCIYMCRYYQFEDFMEDNSTYHIPEDCSERFRKELSESQMGTGG